MKTKYKHSFDTIIFNNRWRLPIYSRPSNWVIIGLYIRWFSPSEYECKFCLFGLDLRVWMRRTPKE
jgi:hypothetical protein